MCSCDFSCPVYFYVSVIWTAILIIFAVIVIERLGKYNVCGDYAICPYFEADHHHRRPPLPPPHHHQEKIVIVSYVLVILIESAYLILLKCSRR